MISKALRPVRGWYEVDMEETWSEDVLFIVK